MPGLGLRPVRINRIKVKVKTLNTSTTVRDPDFRETKENRVYSLPIEIIGQVVGMERTFQLLRTSTGDGTPSVVHFVFRFEDLEKAQAGLLLKKGDRIVQVGEVITDLNIIKAAKASPFGGNRQKSFAHMILLHVDAEQQRKRLGSI
jgi:predicted aconitase with swiveling domain